MKYTRVLFVGILIWIIGVSLYTFSYYVPLLENAEQQANIWLSIIIVPLVWLGSKLYYRNGAHTHGLRTGLIFFGISAILDALITVPLTILPYGGSYYDFFVDFGFWFIGLEFVTTTIVYWYLKVHSKRITPTY